MVRRIDVCAPPRPENLAKAFAADLFFAVYFLSEIHSFADRCATFFDALVDSMKSGAYVVYIDNSATVFVEFVQRLFPPKLFELVHDEKKVSLRLDPDEEKNMLGRYLDLVGRHPRLQTNAATQFILRKK
jgi:hypothetical protein